MDDCLARGDLAGARDCAAVLRKAASHERMAIQWNTFGHAKKMALAGNLACLQKWADSLESVKERIDACFGSADGLLLARKQAQTPVGGLFDESSIFDNLDQNGEEWPVGPILR